MGVKESKSIDDLREATRALAQAQLVAINAGTLSVVDVAHSKIIQGVCEEKE
jgi:hypothetical protein